MECGSLNDWTTFKKTFSTITINEIKKYLKK